MAEARTLVLWDIDDTLIKSRGVGRAIYERVFPTATGRPLHKLATVHGRTERRIMSETLRAHDIEPSEHLMAKLTETLADAFHSATEEFAQRARVLPGTWEALAAFAVEPGTHQGLLTGNTAEIARIKTETFGLDQYVDAALGGYGDDHDDRDQLVTVARERAARELGSPIPVENVILIGDTPNDVNAALDTGADVIAVASGRFSVDELRSAGARKVVPSLREIPALRENHAAGETPPRRQCA